MMSGRKKILLLWLALMSVWVLSAQNLSMFRQESYRHASLSVCVRSLDDGRTVADHQSEKTLSPASVTKLITTAAALECLGADYRFETRLAYDGRLEGPVLRGNVWIVAGGDPSLGSEYAATPSQEFLQQWVAALRQKGIRRIEGQVLLWSDIVDEEPLSPGWTWEDMGNYYAAGVYGVAVFDNQFRLALRSSEEGSCPEILETTPALPRLLIDNRLRAAGRGDSAYFYGEPYRWERVLTGSIPPRQERFVIKGDIPDPEVCLVDLLEGELRRQGILIEGRQMLVEGYRSRAGKVFRPGDRSLPLPESRILLHHRSQPLSEIIQQINYHSLNMFTEYLARAVARARGCSGPVSAAQGLQAVQSFWESQGIDCASWYLKDACGLAPQTAFSTGSMVDILSYMAHSGNARVFARSLPQAGREGTVRSLGTGLPGELRLKSGSRTGVRAYAGYYTVGNRHYAIAFTLNYSKLPYAQVKADLERFILSINH